MKNCVCCSTSKLFMKLKHGLCPNCYEDFLKCKNDYDVLLSTIKSTKFNFNEVIFDINILMIKLRKFDSATHPLKSAECLNLLNWVNDFATHEKNINHNNQVSFSPQTLNKDNNSIAPSNKLNPDMNHISSFEHSNVLNETNILPETQNIQFPPPIVNVTNNTNPNFTNTNPNFTNTNPNFTKKHEVKSNKSTIEPIIIPIKIPVKKTIKRPLTPEDYEKAREIISLINNNRNDVDELCYNTLLLKNEYLPLFNDNNVFEIDNINLENLIATKLTHASFLLPDDITDIYSYYNYVAFSLQSTGFKIETTDIVEIAAVKVRYGKIVDTFHTLVNPSKTISRNNEINLKLSNAQLSKAPVLFYVLQDFLDFIEDLTLVSHNSSLSFGFLSHNYNTIYKHQLTNDTNCLMTLYRKRYSKYHGDAPKKFSLIDCRDDILSQDIINSCEKDSIALTNALYTFNLYEILKKQYKL